MKNDPLQEMRKYIFSIKESIDNIDRFDMFFQNSDKEFYFEDIEKVKNKLFECKRDLGYIYRKIDEKLDELEKENKGRK